MKISKVQNFYKDKILLWVFLFVGISYTIRIIFIANPLIMSDEAHYYIWAKNLPFGFYDHGPGVGFFVRFFIGVFGENSFTLRIGSIISMVIVSWYMYYFCKRNFNQRMAIISILIFNTTIMFQGLTFIMTIDTPFFFSLIMAIMLYYDALYNNTKHFYGAGFFLGFALLSKVSAALAIIPYMIYILVFHRAVFKRKEFYLSLLIALLVYSPFLIFLFQSDFAPIHFMSIRIPNNGNITQTFLFWLAQLLFITPLFFLIFIIKTPLVFFRNIKHPKILYFAVSSFITLLYFIQLSINRHLELNWGLVMYGGGIFIVAQTISHYWNNKIMKGLFFINSLYSLIFISIFITQFYYPVIPLRGDPINRYYDFEVFRTDLKDYYQKHMKKNIVLAGSGYDIPSLFDFYVKPQTPSILLNWHPKPNSSYEFFQPEDKYLNKDIYYLTSSSDISYISGNFVNHQYLTNFISYRNGKPTRTWHLFYMESLTNIQRNLVLNQQ
ncbi:MAG: glycosyltransferase family 39 protein [Brevinema sp.]